jgi:hypothetical protein
MKNKLLFAVAAFLLSSAQLFAQCPIPNGLGVSVVDGTTTLLTWNNMNNASSYKVNIQEGSGNPVTFQFNITVTTNSFTISGLTEGANYKFKVRTNCGGNNSNWSDFFDFTSGTGTTPTTCDIPTGLVTTSIQSNSASLTWDAMANATKYKINVQNAQGNNNPFSLNATPASNAYTVTGLLAGQNYKFKVRTICGQGLKSNFSDYTVFTTAPQKLGEKVNTMIVSAYPNPVSDQLTVQFNALSSSARIQLVDQLGRIAYDEVTDGDIATHHISVAQNIPGIYYLLVTSGDQVISKKLLIAR